MQQNITVCKTMKNIFREKFLRNILTKPVLFRSFSYYNGETQPLSETKTFLRDFKGGTIDLEKKETGIAHIVLNHPERMNALSGKMPLSLK